MDKEIKRMSEDMNRILDSGSKWAKVKLVCSPKSRILMLWYGNSWWKPKYIWLLFSTMVWDIKIAMMIASGKILAPLDKIPQHTNNKGD